MKRFIYKSLFFLFPILAFLIGLEIYVRTDANSFKTIATYFENNKSEVEVLVLGSSHNQNGINPKYFTKKTANISYGAQDIKIDSALVFDNIKEMKNLKTIIFEMDYHRMDIENEPNFYR